MGVSKFVYGGETKFDLTGDNVTPDSLVVGHTAHGADGEPVQGSNPYELQATNAEVGTQAALIAQIAQALEGKAAGGGGGGAPDNRDLYQRVEYINTDGSAHIVTDIFADNNCGMEMIASFPYVADHACMGSRENSSNTRFFAPYPLSSSSTYFGFNTATKITANISVDTAYRWQVNFLNSRLAIVCDMNGINKGSTAISATLAPHTAPIHIFVTVRNDTGNISSTRYLNLYSARISSGSDVVREYIPCYRKSDGVAGVYEKFTGEFLTAPVGAFICGQEIDW